MPRPLSSWLILLTAWAAGLIIWAAYIALLFILFLRLFA